MRRLTLALLIGCLPAAAEARHAMPQTKLVPVARLLANAEKALKAAPKDPAVLARAARLEAMAYVVKADAHEVKTLDGEVWFGFEPRRVPYVDLEPAKKADAKTAAEHLDKAISYYRQALKEKDDLVTELGLAWCLDQAGKKPEALNRYRKVIETGWKAEKDLKSASGQNWSMTLEAIAYAKPLLDPKKDLEELTRYAEEERLLSAKPRSVTPVIVPLGARTDYGALVDREAQVAFDVDGRAPHACRWDWVGPDAGILVYDPDGSGAVRSGLQLFGSVTWWIFWRNGYEALAALDDDGDGWLQGDELAGLAVWRDADGDAASDDGEVRPLAAHGITAIGVRGVEKAGVLTGAIRKDGAEAPSYDWIARCR